MRNQQFVIQSILRPSALAIAVAVGVPAMTAGCDNDTAQHVSTNASSSLAAGEAAHAATEDAQSLSDLDIGRAVENELQAQRGMPAGKINVDVKDGVVSLTGTVGSFVQVQRATQRAELVRGVSSVINQLEVAADGSPDWDIRSSVVEALRDDPATASQIPDVVVKDGVVTVRGQVDSWARRDLVKQVAGAVRGVRGLHDELAVAEGSPISDEELSAEVRERLHDDVRIADDHLDVQVKHGHVVITGTVTSAAERTRAFDDARIAGVKAVDVEKLDVVWWERNPMRLPADLVSERGAEHVTEALRKTFRADPRLLGFEPEIAMNDGTAVLRGDAPTLIAKRASLEDALNTLGVWRVDDRMVVRPVSTLSDSEVAARVQRALVRSPDLRGESMRVLVDHGVASVYGLADNELQKARAEIVAGAAPGVVRVDNQVQVQPTFQPLADAELRRYVQRELAWNPYIRRNAVHVEVSDGVALLSGTVLDWRAYQEAERSARDAGAHHVVNRLEVLEGPAFLAPDVVGAVDARPFPGK